MRSSEPEVAPDGSPVRTVVRASRVRVVLPAYNEEATLPVLLDRLDQAFEDAGLRGDILVVNDGSTDRTVEVVSGRRGSLGVTLLDLQPNGGLAKAIKAGLVAALEGLDADDIIVTMDADNTHTPGLILRMVRMVREGSDVVIASRYQPGARVRGVPFGRQVLSLVASVMFRTLARVPGVRDYTCGYRAYRVEILQRALERYQNKLVEQSGFGCMAELLLKLKPLDPIITEAPLILRYDLKYSMSKMKVWKTVRETVAMLASHTLHRR